MHFLTNKQIMEDRDSSSHQIYCMQLYNLELESYILNIPNLKDQNSATQPSKTETLKALKLYSTLPLAHALREIAVTKLNSEQALQSINMIMSLCSRQFINKMLQLILEYSLTKQ